MSAFRDCLFNSFAATLHIGGRSSIRNLSTRHAVVTGTHKHGEVNDYEDKTINLFTDGSKYEQGVGAEVAIFRGTELITQMKYRLDNNCSNKQAEQLRIIKALETLETLSIDDNSQRTAAVITDSRVALDSIKNIRNHSFIIEEIRLRLSKLKRTNWNIVFSWVKAHVGKRESELADKMTKAGAMDKENTVTFKKYPRAQYTKN